VTYLVVLGMASFYGPAYATRAADQPGCEVVDAIAAREDEQPPALGRPKRATIRDTHRCPVFDDRRLLDRVPVLGLALVVEDGGDSVLGVEYVGQRASHCGHLALDAPTHQLDAVLGL
jgi:hypothetical protein